MGMTHDLAVRDRAIAAVIAGKSFKAVAAAIGVADSTVATWCRAEGIKSMHGSGTTHWHGEAKRLIEEGLLSMRQIAKALDVHPDSVCSFARRNGFSPAELDKKRRRNRKSEVMKRNRKAAKVGRQAKVSKPTDNESWRGVIGRMGGDGPVASEIARMTGDEKRMAIARSNWGGVFDKPGVRSF